MFLVNKCQLIWVSHTLGNVSSSYKISRDWLAILLENNTTNNRTIPPTLKTIAAAYTFKPITRLEGQLTRANPLVFFILNKPVLISRGQKLPGRYLHLTSPILCVTNIDGTLSTPFGEQLLNIMFIITLQSSVLVTATVTQMARRCRCAI